MQKKIPSQTNLVDMLAATGRGILGTLANRFSGYDAAVEKVNAHDTTLAELDYQHNKTRSLAESNAGEIQDNHNEITALKSKVSTLESSSLPWLEVTADNFLESLLTVEGDYVLDASAYIPTNVELNNYRGVKIVDSTYGFVLYCPFSAKMEDNLEVTLGHQQIATKTYALTLSQKKITFANITPQTSSGSSRQVWTIPTYEMIEWMEDSIDEAGANFNFDDSKAKVGDIVKVADNDSLTFLIAKIEDGPSAKTRKQGVLIGTDGVNVIISTFEVGSYNSFFTQSDSRHFAKKTDLPKQPFTFYIDANFLGMTLDGLYQAQVRNGQSVTVPIPTAITEKLNEAYDTFKSYVGNVAGKNPFIATNNPFASLPRFILAFCKEDMAFAFECSGIKGNNMNFKAQIYYDAYYIFASAYWEEGTSKIHFSCVSKTPFDGAGGGAN